MNKQILLILARTSELLHKNKIQIHKKQIQFGGGKKLKVSYNNFNYVFDESLLDEDHYILYSKNNEDCITIIISKSDKTAEIHGIGNFTSCLHEPNQNVGSTLLKITLKLLKKYKEKFNIKMVILSDNSLKLCVKTNIKLSQMLTLISGDTWYGKYGFRPVKNVGNNYIIDEISNKLYEKNKKIINKITITDIDLIKYIKLTNNDKLIKACEKIIQLKPTMLLKDFLGNFISNFNNNCLDFGQFYEQLFYKIMKYDPYRKLFGLIL